MRSRISSAIYLLLFAVWAACPGVSSGAAEDPSDLLQETTYRSILRMQPPVGRELTITTRSNPFGVLKPETDGLPFDSHSPEPEGGTANKTRIVELVIEEFDLFAGLRNTFHEVEHRMDGYLERMKLKGGINFSQNDSNDWEVKENVKLDGGFMVYVKEAFGRKGALKQMLPDRINWSINSDLSGRYIIGELEIGHYLFVEGSVGKEGGCRFIFEVDF